MEKLQIFLTCVPIIVTFAVGLLACFLQASILKIHKENLKVNLFDKRFKICETIRIVIAKALSIQEKDDLMIIFTPLYQTLDESVFLFENDVIDFINRLKGAVGDYYVSVKNYSNPYKSPQERSEATDKMNQLTPILIKMMEERLNIFYRYLKPLNF